jgi:hypothetical protein
MTLLKLASRSRYTAVVALQQRKEQIPRATLSLHSNARLDQSDAGPKIRAVVVHGEER